MENQFWIRRLHHQVSRGDPIITREEEKSIGKKIGKRAEQWRREGKRDELIRRPKHDPKLTSNNSPRLEHPQTTLFIHQEWHLTKRLIDHPLWLFDVAASGDAFEFEVCAQGQFEVDTITRSRVVFEIGRGEDRGDEKDLTWATSWSGGGWWLTVRGRRNMSMTIAP